MPVRTLAILIGGVILAAAFTVAVVFGLMPVGAGGWALPIAILAALVVRYAVGRLT
ncbi:MAG: hypothetical protein AAFP98_08050 [Pseudomonadota bacterium]